MICHQTCFVLRPSLPEIVYEDIKEFLLLLLADWRWLRGLLGTHQRKDPIAATYNRQALAIFQDPGEIKVTEPDLFRLIQVPVGMKKAR